METKREFGRYLQEKRKVLGLSQRELAGQLYVTESAVSKWERGVSYPDITQIAPICDVLGVSEHELITASDDERQRVLEREAGTHRRNRLFWLVGVGICYLAAVAGCLIADLTTGQTPTVWLALTGCLIAASFTHVPLLAPRGHRGIWTLAACYISINLCVLAGCAYAGVDNFPMEFFSLLLGACIVFLPPVLVWCSKRSASPIFEHCALICIGVDSVLMLATIAVGVARMPIAERELGMMAALLLAIYLMAIVWVGLLVFRYLPLRWEFRGALFSLAIGIWVFMVTDMGTLLTTGGAPWWHRSANLAIWTDATLNDNICLLCLLAGIVVAAILAAIGLARKVHEQI